MIKVIELTESNNPYIKNLISHDARYINKEWLKAVEKDGVKYCAWCVETPLAGRQKKYCSKECSHSSTVFCYPQTDGSLPNILARQDWRCANCKFDYKPYLESAWVDQIRTVEGTLNRWCYGDDKYFKNWLAELKEGILDQSVIKKLKAIIRKEFKGDRLPEIDHIIPVAMGGTTLGIENMQCLCKKCHKQKTARDMANIKESR